MLAKQAIEISDVKYVPMCGCSVAHSVILVLLHDLLYNPIFNPPQKYNV